MSVAEEGSSSGAQRPQQVDQPEASTSGAPAQPDYQALYEQVKSKPCKVAQIEQRLEGHNQFPFRTQPSLIERELAPIYDATTLSEVHQALETAGRNLQYLDVFREVNFLVHEQPEDDPEACSVVAQLVEKPWYNAHAATYVQSGETTMELGLGLRNLTGRAEHISGSLEYGWNTSSTFALGWSQPMFMGLPVLLDVRGHQLFRNFQKTSSYSERLRGIVLGLKSMGGKQALQYELAWRTLADPSHLASPSVLRQGGDYLKSALRYTLTEDRRDTAHPAHPGWAVKSTSEVAGLGPDAHLRYLKQQLDAGVNVVLAPGLTFNVAASGGVMLPWGEGWEGRPTCIADRFFIGGLPTVRGFKYKAIGPSDQRRPARTPGSAATSTDTTPPKRDALGGDLFATLFAAALRLQSQAFVNGGNLVQITGTARAPQQALQEFGSTWRWSAGVGIIIPTLFGRFEANYVAVLSAQEHDKLKRGLQLGFATHAFM